ncbi:MAG TPA: hypothetical protein VGH91_04680 [Gammaproteobacteria bacterium]|jgi:hypothetical protein
MADQDFTEVATRALDGRNDTLFLAIHDRLGRAPATVDECVAEIGKMSHYERVCYGAQDWSDDSKRFCPHCRSDHRGSGCPSSDAMAREARHGL